MINMCYVEHRLEGCTYKRQEQYFGGCFGKFDKLGDVTWENVPCNIYSLL